MKSRAVFAAVAVGALSIAGCSGKKADTAQVATTTAPVKTTTTTAPVKAAAPLTGLPVDLDVAERPIVSVKVDNSDQGRVQQAGIDKADLIYEEKVEGTVTRFIAMFGSEDSDLVGPIRSVRTTDPNVVAAFGGVFTFSGGAPIAKRTLRGAPFATVSEDGGSGPFTYPKGHHRPYATYAKTARLRQEAAKGAKAPPPVLPFLATGEAYSPQGAAPAAHATVVFGSRTTALLDWDPASSRWLRTTNGKSQTVQGGGQLGFTTVIIQSVGYKPVGYKDAAQNPVDEAVVVGQGDATILTQGTQMKVRWRKESPTAMTTYTDTAGAPVRVPQGQVLVMLPPLGAGITIS